MGIKDFILKKAVDAIIKMEIQRISNAVGDYAKKRLTEKLQEPSSGAIDSGLGPSRDVVKKFIINQTPFIGAASSQLTSIVLNTLVEYYKIPADKVPANLTQNLLIKSIDLSETTKKLLQYLNGMIPHTGLPEDVQQLIDRYEYDTKVYLNDIAVNVAKDAFIHLTPEIISQHYIGKFLMFFMSKDSMSKILEKFVDQIVPQELIEIDHGKAGKYTITDLTDEDDGWVDVELEKPTLASLLRNRATSVWSAIGGILSGINGVFVRGQPSSKVDDDLPKITKNWFRDNDYPKLTQLRDVYKKAKDELQALKVQLKFFLEKNGNLKQDDFVEIELIKQRLSGIKQQLQEDLDDFDKHYTIDNKVRDKEFREKANQVIGNITTAMNSELTQLSSLKKVTVEHAQDPSMSHLETNSVRLPIVEPSVVGSSIGDLKVDAVVLQDHQLDPVTASQNSSTKQDLIEDLPKITKNWFRDNDYPKLVSLREIYQLEKDKIQLLTNELNQLLKQSQLLENNIKDITPEELGSLKTSLDRISKDLGIVYKNLQTNLDKFDANNKFDNQNRANNFRAVAERIINQRLLDTAKITDNITDKLTKLNTLREVFSQDTRSRANSIVNASSISTDNADIVGNVVQNSSVNLTNSHFDPKTS